MTPDWSSDPEPVPYADLTNPQTLNLYAYAGNNPTTATDADGHREDLYFQDGTTLSFSSDQEYKDWWTYWNGWDGWGFPAAGSSGYITWGGAQLGYAQWTPDHPTFLQAIEGWFGRNQAQGTAESIGIDNGIAPTNVKATSPFMPPEGELEEVAGELLGEATEATSLTEHAAMRLGERGLTQEDVDTAVRTAKAEGRVSFKIGKYGTPQVTYQGSNGITVVVESEGRNAGKAVTVFQQGAQP